MTDKEIMQDLEKICERCGEFKGRHKANDLNCPIIDTSYPGWIRTIGYKETPNYFKQWIEE